MIKHKILLIYTWLIRTILYFFPDSPVFMRFRGFMYSIGMNHCGKDFQVTHDANIKVLEKLSVGNHVFVGNTSLILGGGGVLLGDNVLIGPHVIIVSGNHTFLNGSYRFGKSQLGKIEIQQGSWVAANCTVTQGAVLPESSVLGSNSVLNKAFTETNSLYAGVPAKWIKVIEN